MQGLLLILAIAQLHALTENGHMRREAFFGDKGEIFPHAPKAAAKEPLAPKAPAPRPLLTKRVGPLENKPKNFIQPSCTKSICNTGKAIAIKNPAKFTKEFTVSFKVNFWNFKRNEQFLVSTDEHAFLIQGLGAKYGANSGKISAWMKTDSGLGPDGHGVKGSDNTGSLLSQKLKPKHWYKVKFQKTKDSLFLTVNGKTVSSKVDPRIFAGTTAKEALFDLEAGSKEVVAGKLAGSGDVALRGRMGDLTVIEGAPASAPARANATEEVAKPAAGPTAAAKKIADLKKLADAKAAEAARVKARAHEKKIADWKAAKAAELKKLADAKAAEAAEAAADAKAAEAADAKAAEADAKKIADWKAAKAAEADAKRIADCQKYKTESECQKIADARAAREKIADAKVTAPEKARCATFKCTGKWKTSASAANKECRSETCNADECCWTTGGMR